MNFASLGWWFAVWASFISSPVAQEKRIPELPPAVNRLFFDGTKSGPSAVVQIPADDGRVKSAVWTAAEWIHKALDEAYLPERLEAKCTYHEFENRDVIRHTWSKGGYTFKVTQTGSIFTIRVTPEHGALTNGGYEEKLSAATNLFSRIWVKRGVRWTWQAERIAIPDLNLKILKHSFGRATVRQSDAGPVLWGRPTTMEEENVRFLETPAENEAADAKENPNWENSASAWNYWFRHIHWWSDGGSLGVYFLKLEAGPVPLSYAGSADNKWFGTK